MRYIKLTQGKRTIVDNEDYEWLSKYEWFARREPGTNYFYAVGHFNLHGTDRSMFYMSRLIMGAKKGQIVDHIFHKTLDNRKEKLRLCSIRENTCNSHKIKNRKECKPTTSIYKGVFWNKKDKRWIARLSTEYKRLYIGSFLKEKEAAIAYDKAALIFHGKFAKFNFKKEEKK